jgi:Cu(I)/Ag(I) efflux system membrane fusion protein
VVSARDGLRREASRPGCYFDRVSAGAPLAEIYVPDWVAAQEEYLAVARDAGEGTSGRLRDAATRSACDRPVWAKR